MGTGRVGFEPQQRFQPAFSRQPQVEENDVGPQLWHRFDRRLAAGHLPDELEILLRCEQAAEPLAEDRVIVDNQDSNRRR